MDEFGIGCVFEECLESRTRFGSTCVIDSGLKGGGIEGVEKLVDFADSVSCVSSFCYWKKK